MRSLTMGQKKLLKATLELYEPKNKFVGENPIHNYNTLPEAVWDKLEEMNYTEILWCEVNRFINDWRWNKIKPNN